MNRRRLLILCLAICLPGSITDPSAAASKSKAQITGSVDKSKGFNRLFSVEPVAVDGKSGFQFWSLGSYLNVPAGKHVFDLQARIGRGFLQGVGFSTIPVTANLKAGVKYKAVGKMNGDLVQVWIIEMKSGNRVSDVGSAGYDLCFPNAYNSC